MDLPLPQESPQPQLTVQMAEPSQTVPAPAEETTPVLESSGMDAGASSNDFEQRSVGELVSESLQQAADGTSTPQAQNLTVQEVAISQDAVQTLDQILAETATEVPKDDPPEWVMYEEDLSVPDEEELKEIEQLDTEISALDVSSLEKRFFPEWNDPDQRPIKKLRLSWTIKGVRGTKEKPNFARTFRSPSALVDGKHWSIEFYPRGNDTATLSAYVKCSERPPDPNENAPESTFYQYEGPPDADLGQNAILISTTVGGPESTDVMLASSNEQETGEREPHKSNEIQETHPATLEPSVEITDSAVTLESLLANADSADVPDYRISAQLGVVIYNPAEPRTNVTEISRHQFTQKSKDWGWTHTSGRWDEIQIRQRGQRQALLRNDTIAIDVYILIFHDPTQFLWWHAAENQEESWPSKSITGYFPMGTPLLHHSPAVAGVTAWLLLKPFRNLIQSCDTGRWRSNSQVKPQPLTSQLQMMLYSMRTMLAVTKEPFINVMPVIDHMRDLGESYADIKSFWEAFQRSIELELEHDRDALKQMKNIFGSTDEQWTIPHLPVQDVKDVQQSLNLVLSKHKFRGHPPKFLPLMLEREKFDAKSREWKMLYDRLIMNDEIDLSQWCVDENSSKYTLYGFMVHVGARTSRRFYTIVRPKGVGSQWLAFEDGYGNRVYPYTPHRIQQYEGAEGDALKNLRGTRETAYMAMYIKTSCAMEFFSDGLEPYKLPQWLKPHLEVVHAADDEPSIDLPVDHQEDQVAIEVYADDGVVGREGLLDMFNIRQQSLAPEQFLDLAFPPTARFGDVRRKIAKDFQVDNPDKIRLFIMGYTSYGFYTSAQLEPVDLNAILKTKISAIKPMCLWMALLRTQEEIKLFGYAEMAEPFRQSILQPQNPIGTGDHGLFGTPETTDSSAQGNENLSPDLEVAGPDAMQLSVQEAVAIIVETSQRTPTEQADPVETEVSLASLNNLSEGLSEDPTNVGNSSPVEHGHLVDAAMHESEATTHVAVTETPAQEGHGGVSEGRADSDQDSIDSILVGADVEVIDVVEETASTQRPLANARMRSPHPRKTKRKRPVANVYGFLQILDVEKQNFRVHSTFFARCNDQVKEVVRKCMEYRSDQEFQVWHRESTMEGSLVPENATFNDIRFTNGVDIIVGDVLPEAKIQELEQEGKFSTTFALSRYLRMCARRHPFESTTNMEPIELASFGSDYYRGPLVNGMAHGRKCLRISENGETYEGPLICNKKSGPNGKMTYQNGDVYEGEWFNDERHGHGTFVEKRTGNKYVGGFENGKRWGKGVTYWEVADEEADMCQICYGEEINALFFYCGHVCACMECAKQCPVCPICRKQVQQVVKMYRA